jgi:hypothetical protein
MTQALYIRPFSWQFDDTADDNVVQLFGRTVTNHTVYVRIHCKITGVAPATGEVLRASAISDPQYRVTPCGVEAALWHARNINPYEVVKITKYAPLPPGHTTCHFNIRCLEEHVEAAESGVDDISDPPRVFYWDLEVNASVTGRFPLASDPRDEIFAVSIRTESEEVNEYVIITRPVNAIEEVVVISAFDERDLISKFFALFTTFAPDYHCHFNGDMFDIRYLLERARICKLDLPYLSKVHTVPARTLVRTFPTPYAPNQAETLSIPGIDSVDVLHYSRSFYPHLPNHRLDTMAKHLVGTGKYELSIDDMMTAVRTNDPEGLTEVVKYSIGDVRVLSDTWGAMDGENVTYSVCSKLRVSLDSLLRAPMADLVDAIVFGVSPPALYQRQHQNPVLTYIRSAPPGIYRTIYTSDYSEVYALAMRTSSDPITAELGRRLIGAPPDLVFMVFRSRYVNNMELMPRFFEMMRDVIHSPTVISVSGTTLWHYQKLSRPGIVMTNYYPIWIRLTDTGPTENNQHYVAVTDRKEFESSGRCSLARPACNVIKEGLLAYMLSVDVFVPPNIREAPITDFAMSVWCTPSTAYVAGTLHDILLHQCDANDVGTRELKYVNTTEGPLLLSRVRPEIIDYHSYTSAINSAIERIRAYHNPL